MRAVRLHEPGKPIADALRIEEVPEPQLAAGEVLVRVEACAVCRTDLHLVLGELPPPRIPLVPGHQVVGRVEETGGEAPPPGARVGLFWLAGACGGCAYCREGRENLCRSAEFTGYSRDGGFAEFVSARADFVLPLPDDADPADTAPLLCGGVIGYRSLRLAGAFEDDRRRVGLFGFGNAAHIAVQLLVAAGKEVFVATRGAAHRALARALGASWAGAAGEVPVLLDAAVVFAPAGEVVPKALEATAPGGTVVLGGVQMTGIPPLDYRTHLYDERVLRSAANATREDARGFLEAARRAGVRTTVRRYRLEEAPQALSDLAGGRLKAAAVLVP